MNVSKINVLKINNSGVSPFSGDAPVYNDKPENKKINRADKFLYGAGIVSAGILAAALAARFGVFGRGKNVVDEVSGLTNEIKDSLLKFDAKPVKKQFVPMCPPREERLKKGAVNLDKYKSVIPYNKFEKYKTVSEQTEFFNQVYSKLESLSYERQYEEFGYFLDFLKNHKASDVKVDIKFNLDNYKRDNRFRISRDIVRFSKNNPEYQGHFKNFVDEVKDYFVDYSKYNTDKLSDKVSFFTNVENKIAKLKGEVQLEEFENYLAFIKTLDPEDLTYNILFTPGKYGLENNVKIAKLALKFAEENPQFKDVILNNLVAYEPAADFARDLAYAGFRKTDAFDAIYDTHVRSIIEIRKLLAESELKPTRNTILKNRQDWINIGLPTPNRYMLGFQFSEQIADIRKAAFEYDMKNGITQKEADFMIRELSADTSVAKKSLKEVLDELKNSKIPQERAENLFNQLLEDKKLLAKQLQEADLSNVKNSDFVLSELAEKSALINKRMTNVFDEFEKYGITQKQTQKYLEQLTTERKLTETQEKYGMTLDEMIDKINKAIVD